MSHISIYYHIIFRTKCSQPTIDEQNERSLFSYINSFCRNRHSYLYRINGMPNHIHMLVNIHQMYAVGRFMQSLKSETSKWMKSSGLFANFVGWANGYACFSYGFMGKDRIYNYIKNQKEHHKTVTFESEFRTVMLENNLDPDTDMFLSDDDSVNPPDVAGM